MKSAKTVWSEYCEKSSLHGLRYVVHKEATSWERYDFDVQSFDGNYLFVQYFDVQGFDGNNFCVQDFEIQVQYIDVQDFDFQPFDIQSLEGLPILNTLYEENGCLFPPEIRAQEQSENPQLLWAVLMAVASVTILVHLYASWKTFSYSSMQIVVDNPRYPLSKIDFPAVTICSMNKILYSKAKILILSKYENEPELKRKYENSLYILEMLQYPYYKDLSVFAETNPDLIDLPVENITDIMLKLMPKVEDMFDTCYWRGTGYNCSDILRLQRTEEGFCYSFNSKTSERMTK